MANPVELMVREHAGSLDHVDQKADQIYHHQFNAPPSPRSVASMPNYDDPELPLNRDYEHWGFHHPQEEHRVPLRSKPIKFWCLSLKRRSVFTRTLMLWACPRRIVFSWQILEEARWALNRLALIRPLVCVSCCKCNKLSSLNDFLVNMTIADLAMYVALIILQIEILSPSFARLATFQTVHDQFKEIGRPCGTLAAWNFGIAILLGQRNTFWNVFMGIAFDRSIRMHRWVGRLGILCATIHVISYLNWWYATGVESGGTTSGWQNISDASQSDLIIAGWIAFASAICIFLFSLNFFRRRTFEFFVKTHWICFLILLWYGGKHDPKFVGAVLYAVIFWGGDLVWRTMLAFAPWKRVRIVKVKLLPGNVVRMEFQKEQFVFESGQFVMMCVPALDFTEWHPFSISSCPHEDTVMIHIRVLGSWTKKLRRLCGRRDIDWSKITVFFEGPYGSPSIPLHYYQNVVFLSGGIGITPMQSLFNELIYEIRQGRVMKRVHFVWTCRDLSMVNEWTENHWAAVPYGGEEEMGRNASERLPEQFSPDLFLIHPRRRGSVMKESQVITHFHLTRVPREKQALLRQKFPYVFFGRPDIRQIVEAAVNAFVDETGIACGMGIFGVAVLACGPPSLIRQTKRICAELGVACHTEIFEF